jgi:hypothetical protein
MRWPVDEKVRLPVAMPTFPDVSIDNRFVPPVARFMAAVLLAVRTMPSTDALMVLDIT